VQGRIPGLAEPAVYLDRLERALKTICSQGADMGVKVFTEVINHYEGNIFVTARETLEFLTTRDIPNCYVHLDTYHMNLEEADPLEAIRLCGKRLGYFHVADNHRQYPGSGVLDFRRCLAVLKEIGYRGFISIECLPRPDGISAAKRGIEHLKQMEEDHESVLR
jgi:sugar phosphate isomerase/epimerase